MTGHRPGSIAQPVASPRAISLLLSPLVNMIDALTTRKPSARAERSTKRQLVSRFADDLLRSVDDAKRLCPMLAGASRIQVGRKNSRLTVRTAAEEIEVAAPRRLLEAVFELCDGSKTLEEVTSSVKDLQLREELSEFLGFLLQEGALIDGNLACAEAARYAHQFNPVGMAAPARVTGSIARRFSWDANAEDPLGSLPTFEVSDAPLASFFSARITQYTFADLTPSDDALHSLLWSLAGIVSCTHPRTKALMPHRTLGSAGGMHLLEVYFALLRPTTAHSAGVYRVHYLSESSISLEQLADDVQDIPLAFGKPWELTHATGVVFIAADPVIAATRYRNRSLQYLFMEAGAALHNGALSADPLGLSYATIGGYYEGPIKQLCKLDRQLILGSAVFGSKPGADDVSKLGKMPDIEFAWVNTVSPAFTPNFSLARARIKTADEDLPYTWGRSTNPSLAMRKAIAEAIERQGFREPRELFTGGLAQLQGAIDPRAMVAYSEKQYKAPSFPYERFSDRKPYVWTRGSDLVSGKDVYVLAELVFSRGSLREKGFELGKPYSQSNSSGCAAGVSPDDASFRALLEVVERHAFMAHWLRQEPGHSVDINRCDEQVASRVRALAYAGCRVSVQMLDTDLAHVALVAAQNPALCFTTMGTAADVDAANAIESALDELEARVYAWQNGHRPSISRAQDVATTEHHFELYGLPKFFRNADAVLFPAESEQQHAVPAPLPFRDLSGFVSHLSKQGAHPVVVDITPARHCIDQGKTPLTVVKVFVPGLLPMSFGYGTEPLGLVTEAHPASRFPHPFP